MSEDAVACERPDLRRELLDRSVVDQAVRLSEDRSDAHLARWRQVDQENTEWLESVVAEHGWPGTKLVGADGSHAAWLLAQHADQQPEFQAGCLELLDRAVKDHDAEPADYAYLYDRVAVAQNRPQLYGTQYTRNENGEPVPYELEDAMNIDAHRAAVGLGTLAEYDQIMRTPPEERYRKARESLLDNS